MPGTSASNIHIHVTNLFGFVGFLLLWLGFVECTRWLMRALRNDPLIGWAIGPLGISTLFLYEPSTRFILLSTIFPALVSGCLLYFGLFTTFPSPLILPHNVPTIVLALALGIVVTSLGDCLHALHDLRYPLWGEVRILRNIQSLRASCASIHFTNFGRSYLREHFGSNPSELLQAL